MRREHSTGPASCKSQIYLKTEALHFFFKKKKILCCGYHALVEPKSACVYTLEFYKEP